MYFHPEPILFLIEATQVDVACFLVAEKIWNWGLSQYQSTGF